jgi:hypothetical protein
MQKRIYQLKRGLERSELYVKTAIIKFVSRPIRNHFARRTAWYGALSLMAKN